MFSMAVELTVILLVTFHLLAVVVVALLGVLFFVIVFPWGLLLLVAVDLLCMNIVALLLYKGALTKQPQISVYSINSLSSVGYLSFSSLSSFFSQVASGLPKWS
jgi:hypothetical protein